VAISTPADTHSALTDAALDLGLAVVCDKPFALDAAAARASVERAERLGLPLAPYQNRRWDSDFLTVRSLVDRGELGTVTRFESRFERFRPEIKEGWREHGDPADAGGVLFDLGSHLIDQALQLFGPLESIYGELDARRPGAEVDDDAFVALEHMNGARSHLWMSAVAADLGPRMRVLGDRAAYVKRGLDVQEAALRAGGSPIDHGWGEEPEADWGVVGAGEEWAPERTEPGAYQRFYEGVERALREGTPPPVDPDEVVATLEVIDAVRSVSPRPASGGLPEPPV
jgi:scyllo-inositol 2-dehydrogenase (NADP+)